MVVDSGRAPHLFQSLEDVDSRGSAFSASVLFHVVMVCALVALPMVFTEKLTTKFDYVPIAVPPPEVLEVTHWKQPPPKPLLRQPEKILASSPTITAPTPEPERLVADVKAPEPPKIREVKPPEISLQDETLRLENKNLRIKEPESPEVAPPKLEVRTNVFSTGSSAKPTLNVPAHEVQTGGFGDPNGVRGEGRSEKAVNIASLGSFDLPAGPGAGNGTAGARGVRGIVVGAGFGNGTAPSGANGGNAGGLIGRPVREGAFANAQDLPLPVVKKKRDGGPLQAPVEILAKPRPEYTEEARNIKLEGEILLRVLFAATGEVRILEVIRGLGHGLDENAVRAAQKIRFKPALREGEPVDSTATVHILFELAY